MTSERKERERDPLLSLFQSSATPMLTLSQFFDSRLLWLLPMAAGERGNQHAGGWRERERKKGKLKKRERDLSIAGYHRMSAFSFFLSFFSLSLHLFPSITPPITYAQPRRWW
jgi:hypothetical protein